MAATVAFHGVRGSCPCSDPALSRYGGGTACVSVAAAPGEPPVILDLGTGSRPLGEALVARYLPGTGMSPGAPERPPAPQERPAEEPPRLALAVFVTHLHFDHVQGLPFFLPALREEIRLDIYGPVQEEGSFEAALGAFIRPPYFPVPLGELPAEITLNELSDGAVVEVGSVSVLARGVPHRGATLGYRLDCPSGSVAYLSDHQAPRHEGGPRVSEAALELAAGADLLIHDAQYTGAEFLVKGHWGHSTPGYAVEVARAAGARRLALFHHDPTHDDDSLDRLGEEASRLAGERLEVVVAAEGLSLELGG